MTKDTAVYTTPLQVVPDPRTKHTAEDRRAQFDLATKLHGTLADMTFAVDRMNGVRQALDDRAAKLPAGGAPGTRLRGAWGAGGALRKEIVATEGGGMITREGRVG